MGLGVYNGGFMIADPIETYFRSICLASVGSGCNLQHTAEDGLQRHDILGAANG